MNNPVVIVGLIAAAFTALATIVVALVTHYSNKPGHEADAAETNARAAAALVAPLVDRLESLEAKCAKFENIIEELQATIEATENPNA